MNLANQVQILVKTVLLCANALEKGINPFLPLPIVITKTDKRKLISKNNPWKYFLNNLLFIYDCAKMQQIIGQETVEK